MIGKVTISASGAEVALYRLSRRDNVKITLRIDYSNLSVRKTVTPKFGSC
jgi:hypothetical protein